MTTIEIGNLYSKLIDAPPHILVGVDTLLAIPQPNAKFSHAYKSGRWDGMIRFFKMGSKKFPSGLLSQVVSVLKRNNEEYKIKDIRKAIPHTIGDDIILLDNKIGSITLRDYQYEAVLRGLKSTRGVVNVATNGGKTEIACGIIQSIMDHLKAGEKILFFTHAKEIFYQSAARISERLGVEVGLVGDGVWDEKPITVVMIPTIGKYLTVPSKLPKVAKITKLNNKLVSLGKSDPELSKSIRDEISLLESEEWDRLKTNNKKTKKLLDSAVAFIADEVHHASSDTWHDAFMSLKNCYYRFGLTGTVDEDDEIASNKLFGATGKIVMKVTNKFLIENGYSAEPTVFLKNPECPNMDGGDYRDAYDMGVVYNEIRNQMFADIIEERAKSGDQCLIIVNETSHGEVIEEILEGMGVDSVFTHGNRSTSFRQDALDRLRSGEIRVLIATPILDEGVDVSGINCLFLMAAGKSFRQVLQRIGRGLRKKEDGSGLAVYDSLDYHNKYLAEHTLERYNTYKAEGFNIVKL